MHSRRDLIYILTSRSLCANSTDLDLTAGDGYLFRDLQHCSSFTLREPVTQNLWVALFIFELPYYRPSSKLTCRYGVQRNNSLGTSSVLSATCVLCLLLTSHKNIHYKPDGQEKNHFLLLLKSNLILCFLVYHMTGLA